MKEVVIVSATDLEIEPLRSWMTNNLEQKSDRYLLHDLEIELIVTGIGMVRTAYQLGARFAQSQPSLCLNIGLAGSFPGKYSRGQVVEITSDAMPELGAEDRDGALLSLGDIGLDEDMDSWRGLSNPMSVVHTGLPAARGITVNTVHGHKPSIDTIISRMDPDVETMESAAVFYCCQLSGVDFAVIRAVSNVVEPRNKDSWAIEPALENLTVEVKRVLENIRL